MTDRRRSTQLLARVDALEAALERGGGRVPAPTALAVRRTVRGVRERLALGVDHTVVALVGGTGSGKSSLFNALTGLRLAEVGVSRPTTSQASACVWAHDASALLDWLGVPPDRRMERESALDGQTQADLRGLLLLDLPDHDSVEPAHRALVDRMLPQADVLVWVVDPQKYADDALHTAYLQTLRGHGAAMVVVLNQMDTVAPDLRPRLLADLTRLLAEDGLAGVAVHGVSARTGEGVPALRAALAGTVSGRGVAERRAAAELDDAARLLAASAGSDGPDEAALPIADAVRGLAEAVGLPVAAAAARTGRAPARLGPAQGDRVETVHRRWLAAAGQGLPAPWQASLAEAVAPPGALRETVDERVAAVRPARVGRGVLRTVQAAAVLLAVIAVVLAVMTLTALGAGPDERGPATTAAWAVVAALAAGAAVLAGRVLRRRTAERTAIALEAGVGAALAGVVAERLAAPTRALLADHRTVRIAGALLRDD